uniref:DUF4390 domain-containing protein n=1 Tax=Fundidesulfovibrio putealis TaxID=270496 RepID=A0A7C4AGG2_9BACT
MNSLRILILLPLALALGIGCAQQAHAQRLTLTNLVVDNQEGRIKVRFGLDFKDVEAVDEALRRGETLALECSATLARKRDYAWNAEVAGGRLGGSLTLHDGGPYEILMPSARQQRFRGRDLGLVMREAWSSLTMDIGAWSSLTRGQTYSLSLEIRLVRQDVPEWVKGTLFFWSFDAAPPIKYQLDFTY